MDINDKKIILCRPQGGLNDKLSQIEICCEYAEIHDRIVIVDTIYKSKTSFFEEFSRYFVSKKSNLKLNSTCYKGQLERMLVYPASLIGRLYSYDGIYVENHNFVDTSNGCKLGFNLLKSYEEQLIIHHQAGGLPNKALNFFNRIELTGDLKLELRSRLLNLGNQYAAAHIRNTDMETDYKDAINFLNKKNIEKLFLATDNKIVLDEIKLRYKNELISFTSLPSNEGKPLQNLSENVNFDRRNKDSILDLLTLAMASELFLFKVKNNKYSEYSGFSTLALLLHNNKELLKSVVS